MRLGGSLARRRGKWGRRRRDHEFVDYSTSFLARWTHGPRFPAAVTGLTLLGWAVGYLVATQVAFPAPPPPGDLFAVPDVRGLTLAEASDRLVDAGLGLGTVDSLRHPSVARASILGQAPIPGQLAPPGGPVRVTVSLGPQTRSVPDVRRLERGQARVLLETSGFVVSEDSTFDDVPAGRVVDVFPPPDSVVALPAEVEIVVSRGPPIVTMPLVLGLPREDAVRLLTARGLVVAEVRQVFRFGRDRGIVVGQVPAAETVLERGAEVRLTVGRERAPEADPEGTMQPGNRSLLRSPVASPGTLGTQDERRR